MKKHLFSLAALSSIRFSTPLKPLNNFNLILQLDKGH